jgi:hypothetical protein
VIVSVVITEPELQFVSQLPHSKSGGERMGKRFLVVSKGSTGAIELHPMKQWLRENVSLIPGGAYRKGQTSRQWLGFLKKNGWQINELAEEVRLIRPDLVDDAISISVLGEPSDEEFESPDAVFQFEFEKHLRDFLANNLAKLPIENKVLRLYKDDTGRAGIEYPTGVGDVDILAIDELGQFVVFELKLTRGPDRTMGQLLRYMGWIKKNLSKDKEVYGVIVAKDMDEKLRFAAVMVPRVSLLEYEVDFRLKPTFI